MRLWTGRGIGWEAASITKVRKQSPQPSSDGETKMCRREGSLVRTGGQQLQMEPTSLRRGKPGMPGNTGNGLVKRKRMKKCVGTSEGWAVFLLVTGQPCLSPTPLFSARREATKFLRVPGLRGMSVTNTSDDVVTCRTLGFSILGESEHLVFRRHGCIISEESVLLLWSLSGGLGMEREGMDVK